MSRGGFKAFCVDVNGVVGGGSITDVEGVLSQITAGIVETSQGWSFDSTKTASKNDFVNVGKSGRAQFLTHSGGAKLCISMCITGGTTAPFNLNSYANPESGPTSMDGILGGGGLSISMIPPNRGDYDITKITQSDFMPNSALRLSGFGMSYDSSYCPKCFVERRDMNGKTFRYMIIVRNDVILAAGRRLDNYDSCVFFMIGNFVDCAQEGDLNSYASFNPFRDYNSSSEGDDDLESFRQSDESSKSISPENFSNAQIYAADGGLLSYKTTYSDTATTARDSNALVTRNTYLVKSFSSDSRRFVSFNVMMNPNPNGDISCGVTSYDYYKGVINPEVLCQIYHDVSQMPLSKGVLLDGGNYKHLCNGVIIGWDSSNTVDFWN